MSLLCNCRSILRTLVFPPGTYWGNTIGPQLHTTQFGRHIAFGCCTSDRLRSSTSSRHSIRRSKTHHRLCSRKGEHRHSELLVRCYRHDLLHQFLDYTRRRPQGCAGGADDADGADGADDVDDVDDDDVDDDREDRVREDRAREDDANAAEINNIRQEM